MSASKQRGTAAETAVVRWLQGAGWPNAERRALSGTQDKGDIAGLPGVMVEVKATRSHDLAGWMAEREVQTDNAGATVGFVVAKRRGTTNPAEWYAICDLDTMAYLLKEAGL